MLRLVADTNASKAYQIDIVLQNGVTGQPSPSPVMLQARSPNGAELLPAQALDVPGGIFSPLAIAGWMNATVAQSSSACNSTSTLTFSLTSRVPLEARFRTVITIYGLLGSQTPGTNRKIPITSLPQVTCWGRTMGCPVLGTYARWFQQQGALVLHMSSDSEGLAALQTLVVSVDLLNRAFPSTEARNVRVKVPSADLSLSFFLHPFPLRVLLLLSLARALSHRQHVSLLGYSHPWMSRCPLGATRIPLFSLQRHR